MQQMTDQMTRLARTLSDWVQAEPRPLLGDRGPGGVNQDDRAGGHIQSAADHLIR